MDVVRVSSLLPANASDVSILDLAREQGCAVITQDMDFSALLALGGHDRPSLVTLRLLNTEPDVVTDRLRKVLPQVEGALRRGCAITIEDHAVRVRQLPIR
jgi:predicted nuclease of predicted toxin-antitoxin system